VHLKELVHVRRGSPLTRARRKSESRTNQRQHVLMLVETDRAKVRFYLRTDNDGYYVTSSMGEISKLTLIKPAVTGPLKASSVVTVCPVVNSK
jgi:hypothetical protein